MDPSQEPSCSAHRWVPRVRWTILGLVLFLGLFFGAASLFGDWYLRFVRASDGHVGLLFLEAAAVWKVPSDAPAYAVLLGTRPPFVSFSAFSLGWRDSLRRASFERRPEVQGTLVVLKMQGLTQYYSVWGGRLALVRLERSDGRLTPNIYYAPNITMGPSAPYRSAEDWEQAILSDNEAEILRTLVWLGGYHAPPDAKTVQFLLHENLDQARLAYEVQLRTAVSRRIQDLCKSPNDWIREAAEATTTPHTTKLHDPGGPPRMK
jgi:hypothetical protein